MTTSIIPVKTLKLFGGIRFNNAIEGTFSDGYNFESFPADDDGWGLRRMAGNTLVDDIDSSEFLGVFESIQSGTVYTFVYVKEATECVLYRYDGSAFVEVQDGFTLTATNCNGKDFNNKFYFTNGVEDITVEVGATPEVVTITPLDALGRTHRGLGLWVYDNRLCKTSQYGLIMSTNGDETDWATTGDAGAFYKDYYETTTAVYGFSSGIVIMGRNFTDYLTGSGAENYSLGTVSNMGAVGHNAICSHADKVYFFNGEGIYPLEYNDTNQRKTTDKITLKIDEAFASIDSTKYKDIQLMSIADTGQNKMWFHARYTDYASNSVIWIFDFTLQEWYRRIQQPINYISVIDGDIFSASVAGELLQENYGDTFNGTDITALAQLSMMDFGSAAQAKCIKSAHLLYSSGSDNDFYFKYIYDGDSSIFEEKQIAETFDGIFLLADDAETYGGILADDAETYGDILDPLVSLLTRAFKPTKRFKLLQIELSCRDSGQNFDIQRIELKRIKSKV